MPTDYYTVFYISGTHLREKPVLLRTYFPFIHLMVFIPLPGFIVLPLTLKKIHLEYNLHRDSVVYQINNESLYSSVEHRGGKCPIA